VALQPPQLIVGARVLYVVWLPADPEAAAALVPDELQAAPGSPVYLNQYVVDDAAQISNAGAADAFGAYSLTYLGIELAGLDTDEGQPGRWWTHYFNSSPSMIRYAREHGIPAADGEHETELALEGDTLVATTRLGGREAIRTRSRVVVGTPSRGAGQLRYITRLDGELVSGRYPFVVDAAEEFELQSVELLGGDEALQALRPAEPLQTTFGFYSPSLSFCYPGGEGPLGSEHGS
jgi:hypothetical protein